MEFGTANIGRCLPGQIVDLQEVGTVLFCPKGVVNILSSHKLVVNSKIRKHYNSDQYYQTGNVLYLFYRQMTSKGVRIKCVLTPEGLQLINCAKYFGLGKSECVAEKKSTTTTINLERTCDCVCHNSVGTLSNFQGIVEKKASLLRHFQHIGEHPLEATIINSTFTNGVKNSLITNQEIKMALNMLRHINTTVQGKTTQTQPDAVDAQAQVVDLPLTINEYYGKVELSET